MMARFTTQIRLLALWLGLLAAGADGARAEPIITELMAANTATLADQDGAFSDWIEIYNPDSGVLDLTGWYLTDSTDNRTRWQFPVTTLAPGSYLVVFASNKNRRESGKELHTNFALSASGEYLALVKPDGVTIASEYAPTFPAQTDDVSYGAILRSDGTVSTLSFFSTPTPGRANSASGVLLVETVTFSRRAGPFSNTFNLELSGASTGQKIRYVVSTSSAPGATLPEPTQSSKEYTGRNTPARSRWMHR
jgi:hypothetical protein